MPIPILKNQLKWQCRRGMLELDFWLNTFLDEQFDGLSQEGQHAFVNFLKLEDVECYGLLTGDQGQNPLLGAHGSIVAKIRHVLHITYSTSA